MSKNIRIIAPAGKTTPEKLHETIGFLKNNGYNVSYKSDIYSDDVPYHANSDEYRAEDLIDALTDPDTDIIWCFRGGYGTARLYDYLKDVTIPNNKIVIGFSDITALHLMLSQEHGLKTMHGHVLNQYTTVKDHEDFKLLEDILFSDKNEYSYKIQPLNDVAKHSDSIQAEITGGNMCVITTSIGTEWQIQTYGKILLLEDVGEPGYKVDRMLNHLKQAHLLEDIEAVVFGNFSSDDPYVSFALDRFAHSVDFPVYKCDNFGHSEWNFPFQYGTTAEISTDINGLSNISFEYIV
ncbi:MAG: LD-carboxypeptidase [Alphaproteobacteria bacterium]|nr:LD-carboxypeptidase [Alphaproteobacteria bacterium]OJV17132.1 MAG: hypothetical protein BGO27_06095 [Alphaproteobacteria bacterium 33-17]